MAKGCGWPFSTGVNDPMYQSCIMHDDLYTENKLHGGESLRKQQDLKFLRSMLYRAGTSKLLKLQAYTYYTLARSLGWIPWHFNKKNGK